MDAGNEQSRKRDSVRSQYGEGRGGVGGDGHQELLWALGPEVGVAAGGLHLIRTYPFFLIYIFLFYVSFFFLTLFIVFPPDSVSPRHLHRPLGNRTPSLSSRRPPLPLHRLAPSPA
jgi:hypothetical protein